MENTRKKIESLFGEFGVWKKLTADDWAMLIAENPEYANRHELKIKSVDYNFRRVMADAADSRYRLFADNRRDGVCLFSSREWMLILSRRPRLFEFAKANGALNILDDYSKSYIAAKQPSLADKFEIGENSCLKTARKKIRPRWKSVLRSS